HGDIMQVIDEKTGKITGSIPGTHGIHDIALAPELNKGFTSDGKDNTVTVFNFKTLEVIKKIPSAGINPDAILYDPYSRCVFAFNGRSSNASVISAQDYRLISVIRLQGKPEFPASDDAGHVYVNIEDKNLVTAIDTKTMKVENSFPLSPGEGPSGIAIDNENHRLFISCNNKIMVIMDDHSGRIIALLPIGSHVDGAAFDPGLKTAFASSGDGILTVIREINGGRFEVIENLPTQKSARTISVDTNTHHVFLPAAEFGPAPPSTPENPRPRPGIKPGSFIILDISPDK
ncbi:MAG: YncE family protein, partial [Brevinematales bacterium]